MNTPTPETRDSEEFAGSVMELLCPSHQDRALVLRQLLDSIGVAASISDDIWAVTLFEKGFRLNVGTVEVMTFKTVPQNWPFPGSVRVPDMFEIRLLLHGDIAADLHKLINCDENTHGILPSNYKSVPQPQSCYVGLGELADGALSNDSYQKIEKALRLFAPHHAEFIRHAARTPTGKVRTKSNFSRTHSPGLYRYAKSFILDGWEAPLTQHDDAYDARDFYNDVSRSLQDSHSLRQTRLATAPKIPDRIFTTSTSFRRNPDVVAEVLLRADGKCEGCLQSAPFTRASDGTPYLEVHHRVMLSAGGEDSVVNAIALCPNCHRAAHYA